MSTTRSIEWDGRTLYGVLDGHLASIARVEHTDSGWQVAIFNGSAIIGTTSMPDEATAHSYAETEVGGRFLRSARAVY